MQAILAVVEGAVRPCKEVQKESGLLTLCCLVLLHGGGPLAGADVCCQWREGHFLRVLGLGARRWLVEGLTARGRWHLLAEVSLQVRSQ